MHELKETEKDRIAQDICREIEASERAKGDLPQRWQRNKDLYHVAPGTTNLNIVEGMQGYTIPLWRPKADRIRAASYSSLTSVEPYVQVIQCGKDGENDQAYELDCMTVVEESEFRMHLSQVILDALNTNNGVLHFKPKKTEKGVCVECNCVQPKDMMCYPASFGTFKEAKTIGHRFFEMKYRVEKKMKDGLWFKCELSPSDPYEVKRTGNEKINKSGPDELSPEDEAIELWEVIREMSIDGGPRAKYLCVVAYQSQKLLSIESYPYEFPWYVSFKTDREGGKVWSSDSVAQSLQGIQLAYSDTINILIQGSYQAAFPPVAIIGGTFNGKAKKYGPGQVWEIPDTSAQVVTIPIRFDPGKMSELVEKYEQIADSVTGINRLGEGQNLPASTKATAIDALMQSMAEAKDAYTDALGKGVQDVWELLHEYFRLHFFEIKQYFGSKLNLESPEQVPTSVRFEVTGQSSSSSPATMLQKLQMARQIASDPASMYDPAKIDDQIMQCLDLPFATSGLKKDALSVIMQTVQALGQLGIPPEQIAQQLTQEVMSVATQRATEAAIAGQDPSVSPVSPMGAGQGMSEGAA